MESKYMWCKGDLKQGKPQEVINRWKEYMEELYYNNMTGGCCVLFSSLSWIFCSSSAKNNSPSHILRFLHPNSIEFKRVFPTLLR